MAGKSDKVALHIKWPPLKGGPKHPLIHLRFYSKSKLIYSYRLGRFPITTKEKNGVRWNVWPNENDVAKMVSLIEEGKDNTRYPLFGIVNVVNNYALLKEVEKNTVVHVERSLEHILRESDELEVLTLLNKIKREKLGKIAVVKPTPSGGDNVVSLRA